MLVAVRSVTARLSTLPPADGRYTVPRIRLLNDAHGGSGCSLSAVIEGLKKQPRQSYVPTRPTSAEFVKPLS